MKYSMLISPNNILQTSIKLKKPPRSPVYVLQVEVLGFKSLIVSRGSTEVKDGMSIIVH